MTNPKPGCTVEGCPEPVLARGYCSMHYARWRKDGDPGPAQRLTKKRSRYTRCNVDGCEGTPRALGYCEMHYRRIKATGDPGKASRERRAPGDPIPPCSVDGCEREPHARGYCTMHYNRWNTTGDPGEAAPRKLTPGAYEYCTVEGCGRDHYRKGYCTMHYQRNRLWGHVGGPDAVPIGNWNRREEIGYIGAHSRLRMARGSASKHICVQCGQKAEEWAYDNLGGDTERADPRGLLYSVDPDRYIPMCVPCHRTFDTLHRIMTKAAAQV